MNKDKHANIVPLEKEKMELENCDCDHCGTELTIGDHPSCCSDCWEENAEYYE